ncbi:hypothetical protein BH23CHL5_BH23CHL5_21410 [soil metagenome]
MIYGNILASRRVILATLGDSQLPLNRRFSRDVRKSGNFGQTTCVVVL